MRLYTCVAAMGLVGCSNASNATPPTPTTHASCGHAHNDYEHPRPLQDALAAGMCSVEADIFLDGDELLVAHERDETDPSRTLQSLYLDPLRSSPPAESLVLLIDIKSDGPDTYRRLHTVLEGYADILTQWDDGVETRRAVTAIISGNRDREGMEAQSRRFAALDGRESDLDENTASAALIPLVSNNWRFVIGWSPPDPVSTDQRAALDDLVQLAHSQGRLVRFWASPDETSSWQLQQEAGVDFINTDDLTGLGSFLNP